MHSFALESTEYITTYPSKTYLYRAAEFIQLVSQTVSTVMQYFCTAMSPTLSLGACSVFPSMRCL